MLKGRHRLLLAGALAAVLAIGAGAAIGATGGSGDGFLADVAKRLGISEEKLTDAIQDARIAQIDAAVKAGDLTEEQGAELKERVRSGAGLAFGPGFGHRGPFGHGPGRGAHTDMLEAAAGYLGVTVASLRESLRDGQSLADVAKAKGKSVDGLKAALRTAVREDLDEAVTDGKLTKAQADELAERLNEHVDRMVEEGFRFGMRMHMRGPGDGMGFFFGPGGGPSFERVEPAEVPALDASTA